MKTWQMVGAGLVLAAGAATYAGDWAANGNKLFYNGGKVGVGVFNPNSKLQVVSSIAAADRPTLLVKMTNSSPEPYNAAIRGTNRGTGVNGIGVWGSQDGGGYGLYGTASTGGFGVVGEAGSGGTGGFFSATGAGYGVFAEASASLGTNYAVYADCNSAGGYDFYAAGAGTNYGAASSRRWKSNIRSINAPLAKLAQLRGVYFDWDRAHGGHHDVGMIAEEVGAVLPEIVQYEANGVDASGMDYSKVTPLLVEAVNALRAEKDLEIEQVRAETGAAMAELQAENDALRAMLYELRAEVDAIKAHHLETAK